MIVYGFYNMNVTDIRLHSVVDVVKQWLLKQAFWLPCLKFVFENDSKMTRKELSVPVVRVKPNKIQYGQSTQSSAAPIQWHSFGALASKIVRAD